MFRSVAHQLYGLEDEHLELRQVLKGNIEGNKEWYRCLCMGDLSFKDHVNQIGCKGVWGTQVELQATSDLFSVCVYVASLNQQNVYCWHQFKPHTASVPESRCSLRLPVYPFTANHMDSAG